MSWLIYSFLMFFFSITHYLSLRKLQLMKLPRSWTTLAMFLPGLPVLLLFALFSGTSIEINWLLWLAMIAATFFFSYLGNIFSVKGIKQAPNSGFSLIIQKSYAIFTVFAAVVLFGSSISLQAFIAILIVIGFSALIMLEKTKAEQKINWTWLIPSFLAFFCFGCLALFTKWLLMQGVPSLTRTIWGNILVSVMFSIDLMSNRKKDKETAPKLNRLMIFLIFTTGISNALFNLFMNYGFQEAPNVAYVNIINTASITPITLLSVWLFKERINLRKLIGVLGVTAGIALLVLGS